MTTVTRLPFHIMDEVLAHSDDPVEPVTVQIEAQATGRLDPERTHAAVAAAIMIHPLARARLEPWCDSDVGYEWLIDPTPQIDPFRVVDAPDDDLDRVRSEFYSRPLSLFESPPLRVLLVCGSRADTLMVSLHHSASDGMGALRFLQSVLRHYGDLDDPLPSIEPGEARELAVPKEAPTPGDLVRMGKVELQRLSRIGPRSTRLVPVGGVERAGYGVHTMELALGPVVASPIRKEEGATVNDLLIVAASRAAARWIDDHDGEAAKISVSMPINARPAEWSTEIVANLVSGEAVATTRKQRESTRGCLSVVAGWTDAVKARGPGPAIAALARVPHRGVGARRTAMRAASWLGAGNVTGTMILSNLGRIAPDWLGAGAPEVTRVYFSPPAAMPSGLGLGVVAIGETLVLTLRHRWALWSSEAAQQFAALLRSELDEASAS